MEGQLHKVGRWTTSTMISDLGVTRSEVRMDYVQDVVPPNQLVLCMKFFMDGVHGCNTYETWFFLIHFFFTDVLRPNGLV